MCVPFMFIVYYLFLPTNAHTYIKILNCFYKTLLHVSVFMHHLQGALRFMKLSNIIYLLTHSIEQIPS